MKASKRIISAALCCIIAFSILCVDVFAAIPDNFPNTYVNTGNQSEDIIGVALTQNGYYEMDLNGNRIYGDDGGYTKYAQWYAPGSYGWAWCAMFVSWCADQAGIPSDVVCRSMRCRDMVTFYKERGVFHTQSPKRGDIMFYDGNGDGISDHVAIVIDVYGDGVLTIQGNSRYSEGVWICCKKFYYYDDAVIYGYASPNYGGASIPVYNYDTPFRDVFRNAWYYDAVTNAYGAGIVSGTSRFTYEPEMKLTRAMFVSLLMNMSGADKNQYTHSDFLDVDDGRWYTSAVSWAYDTGITYGVSDSMFLPAGVLTRQEAAGMLERYYLNIIGGTVDTDTSKMNSYFDVQTVAVWAKDAMAWAINTGVLSGLPNNTLNPMGGADRAQGAQLIYKFTTLFK